MEATRRPLPLTRRDVLRLTVAGGVAAGLGPSIGEGAQAAAQAQGPITPQDALKALVEGNARYVSNVLISFDEDMALIRGDNEESQQPFASVLSCADSRVPVEIVFDQTLGRLFVTRVAGNIATPEIIASLEYGTAVLGTKLIMVLGHGSCGAVSAAIAVKAAPGQISALYAHIRPAITQAGPNIDATARANARNHALLLRESSPVLSDLVKKGDLLIVAAYYDLASGKVTVLP